MASTKETYLQFLKNKGISAENIGIAFKLSDGQIVFFPFDEEFNDTFLKSIIRFKTRIL